MRLNIYIELETGILIVGLMICAHASSKFLIVIGNYPKVVTYVGASFEIKRVIRLSWMFKSEAIEINNP